MSDTDNEIKVYDDVPRSGLAVRTKDQAQAALMRMRGDTPPNQCEFQCIMCGWRGTLELTDDEIAAVGGDVEMYGGPCPGSAKDEKGEPVYEKDAQGEFVLDANNQKTPTPCLQMALLPRRRMGDEQFTPGDQVTKRARLKELREAAEVNADVLVEKAAGAVTAIFAGAATPNVPAPDAPKPTE